MAIRKYKPTTLGRRQSSVSEFSEVTCSTSEKPLLCPLSETGDRNVHGYTITCHKGGGRKRQYRVIDFRRNDKDGIPAKVVHIEYDPNRTANIALLYYADGEKCYIIAPKNLKQGAIAESGANADIKAGNNLLLRNIPTGSAIHCVELKPGAGIQLARSAGIFTQLLGKEDKYVTLRMSSPEIRYVDACCRVTVDEVGSQDQTNIRWGKAGRMRRKGWCPIVRGVVMNLADHPYSGGEGKTSGGRHPVSPWGQKEGHTCKPNRPSDQLIVRRRRTNKSKKR